MDLFDVSAAQVMALATLTLSLSVAYWLVRERNDRPQPPQVEQRRRGEAEDP